MLCYKTFNTASVTTALHLKVKHFLKANFISFGVEPWLHNMMSTGPLRRGKVSQALQRLGGPAVGQKYKVCQNVSF